MPEVIFPKYFSYGVFEVCEHMYLMKSLFYCEWMDTKFINLHSVLG